MSLVLFQLGRRLQVTAAAMDALAAADADKNANTLASVESGGITAHILAAGANTAADLLRRHITGDFGALDRHDIAENMRAAKHGGRVMSEYVLATGVKLWIITEADRSATTLLLPEEY